MKIRWLGHACFLITSSKGTRILTDPFDETVGYAIPTAEADYVTVSHGHFDHSGTNLVKGRPRVIRDVGAHQLGDVAAHGIQTFHDDVQGQKRGKNTVFVLEVDGVRVCHLGDLGHIPTQDQISAIGRVDVLLIPVGGAYTIDSAGAARVTELLAPKVVIPMHFKTDALSFPIEPVDPFLKKVGGGTRTGGATLEITAQDLVGPRKVYVLEYA
ncbi:MAG: MBL fold metallo-hydrolase [Ignavibacteriales bacterium]